MCVVSRERLFPGEIPAVTCADGVRSWPGTFLTAGSVRCKEIPIFVFIPGTESRHRNFQTCTVFQLVYYVQK